MRRTVLGLAPVLATLPLIGAAPAHALSCVGADEVIADAEQVFTGRIVDAAAGRVLLEVEEVWKGDPVEERVWMRVDLPGWSEWADPDGEVPDGYSSPDRWVFAPYDASVGPCTAWRLDARLVRRHAPDEPEAPVPDGALERPADSAPPAGEEPPVLGAAGLGLGSGAVAAALALGALRRRSPRRRSHRRPG